MNRLRLEFHTHTFASKDSLTTPEQLLAACRRRGVDRVVVTDHNTIAGALAVQRLDPERVIVGEEIMTTRGEILAAYVTEEIPRGLAPQEAIRRLRAQGAFISVSHPFDSVRSGAWDLVDLLEIAPLVDAVEVFNARCMRPEFNQQALAFAQAHGLLGTAGSDAHAALEIGTAVNLVEPFQGPEEMRLALRDGVIQGRLSPFWVHFFSSYARARKQMKRTHPG